MRLFMDKLWCRDSGCKVRKFSLGVLIKVMLIFRAMALLVYDMCYLFIGQIMTRGMKLFVCLSTLFSATLLQCIGKRSIDPIETYGCAAKKRQTQA
jgi:hypothetical protein